jgi:ankyrin repeat protein
MTAAVFEARFNPRRARSALAMLAMAAGLAGCDAAMGPLHQAAMTGDAEFVKSWIVQKRNVDVTFDEPSRGLEGNYARAQGMTALMLAARAGQFDIVKLLAEGGANLYAESNWRDGSHPRNAFDYAVEHAVERAGRLEAVEYLWRRSDGVRYTARLEEHVAASCRRTCNDKHGGDARSNLALFLIGIAPDRQRGIGISEAACYAQRPLELLAFLDKHAVRFPKNTLHCAAYFPAVRNLRSREERIAMVSFFLDRGADLEDSGAGHTPLTGAAATHDPEMVEFLLARGANPNARNATGITAIGLAANSCVFGGSASELEPRQKPQLAVIETLVRAGADARLYASASGRSQLQILTSCCDRKPHTGTQQRICAVFGL